MTKIMFVFLASFLALCVGYPLLPSPRASLDPTFQFRQSQIRQAFLHGYNSYRKYAWGHDELEVRDGEGMSMDWLGGFALTVVDNLDTLIIMEADTEYEEALKLVGALDYNHDVYVSAFEFTIRHLGGLLGAHTLRPSATLLNKARDLGDRLIKAWSGKYINRLINLKTGAGRETPNLAEIGTSQLELRALSWFTGNPVYAQVADKLHDFTTETRFPSGLAPTFWTQKDVSLGGESDSYYEYLLKAYIQNKSLTNFSQEFIESMEGMQKHLVYFSSSVSMGNLTYITRASLGGNNVYTPNFSFEYMTCFVPGLLALGVHTLPKLSAATQMQYKVLAEQVAHTCFVIGNVTRTRLPPDNVVFLTGREVPYIPANPKYLMRPEAAESWFYLSRIGLQPSIAQEYAWSFFLAINSSCRAEIGFHGTSDVNAQNPLPDTVQQSFFLAETLKYLYLTFSPNLLDLQQFVFNTEAHVMPLVDKPLPSYFSLFHVVDETTHAVIVIVTFIAMALLAGIAVAFVYVTLLQIQKPIIHPKDEFEMDSFEGDSRH